MGNWGYNPHKRSYNPTSNWFLEPPVQPIPQHRTLQPIHPKPPVALVPTNLDRRILPRSVNVAPRHASSPERVSTVKIR